MKTFRTVALGILAITIAANSSIAFALGQFATIDTIRSHEGNTVFATFTATETSSIEDAQITFPGWLHFVNEDRTIPISTTLEIEGSVGEIPRLRDIIKANERLDLTSSFIERTRYSNDEVDFTKSFYSISLDGGSASASMVVTDDPLPAVGWLIVATIGYIAARDLVIILNCDSPVQSQTRI